MDLDGSIHGTVHVLIGNKENMGHIPWAAGDPIFWMHHCNIDRLWASWNHCGGKNPTDSAWLDHSFVFADPSGNKVVNKIKDVDSISQLHYSYDHLESCPGKFVPLTAAEAAAIKSVKLAAATPATPLSRTPLRLRLEPQAPPELKGRPLSQHVKTMPEQHKLYLVIRNLHSDVHPEAIYHVYLELPEGTAVKDGGEYQIGTINFFNHVPHQGHSGGLENGPEKFYSFDITDIAKRVLKDRPTVTIAPLGEPAADAKPIVGEISLVEQ
jgi:tyrosinase